MRVTSDFFVSALIRRCFAEGAMAAVLRHGSPEAGAIFVTVDRLDGTVDLYGPAPQTAFDDQPTDRQFILMMERAETAEVDRKLARERDFDPDLWVLAIEDREGRSFLPIAT